MTGAEVSALIFALSCLGSAMLVIWRAAVTMTRLESRLESLEKASDKRDIWEMGLERSLDELTRAIYEVRSDIRATRIRASQGQFDEGNTEPPERNRR